ncbi:MAG: ABC transporter ATP-binding protein [Candidatus Marinimicrobia bacterium]|jgi:ATP-binding cassette subfamily B protein|nr:ABC transporter ATP-binding protein [Candidatus Neomarinimicrobiota bacterium]MBT3577042.1 ABC transporter ATP-binding protein [Candidatus Neomarinimicrobiota bacterium]MBT3679924.1 ABC transporter ATP-binding protein [Candidatus Neomarinimicrobiota bacterium]MBT3949681.1 ABC transporter ATP-binding protein [Candidatus Neomarinimicrobiota bacterium]MBT4253168.1 ABC transporter ATP-binding protein [Candidatus Neomarinimicrobiota bacterium]
MWWDDDFSLDDDNAKTYSFKEMVRGVYPFIRPYNRTFFFALVWAFVGVILVLFQPIILKHIIDSDIPSKNFTALACSAGLYLLTMVLSAVVGFYSNWMAQKAGIFAVNDLKVSLFSHALKLGLPFAESTSTGQLVSRIESDPQRIIAVTSTMAQRLLMSFGMIIGAFIILATVDMRFMLITLAIFPLVIFIAWFSFRYFRPFFRKDRANFSKMIGVLSEFVRSASILQVFDRTDWAIGRVRRSTEDFNRFSIKMNFINYGIFQGLGFMEVGATVIVLMLGVKWVNDGSLTIGALVLFAQYIAQIYWPIFMFTEQISQLQSAGGAADRIFSTLEDKPYIETQSKPVDLPQEVESIVFENVSFGYSDDNLIIKNMSFEIKGGDQVAFVGPTGGGKSTIINLICRFRDPQTGRILLNGIDIREFDVADYRRRFGLVLQDLFLFPAPIAENLRAFRSEVTQQDLEEAANLTDIHTSILNRSDGYATVLKESGEGFSYGQRQLIAFARALAVKPQVLVLDEATSSVDPGTELRIQATMKKLTEGRTSFIVAHRLSTIRRATSIIFVKAGEITESGNHDELIRQKGSYFDLLSHVDPEKEML